MASCMGTNNGMKHKATLFLLLYETKFKFLISDTIMIDYRFWHLTLKNLKFVYYYVTHKNSFELQ